MNELINNLIAAGYLKTPRIIEAFRQIDRADFVPENLLSEAYGNYPLPIGYNQTISQPLTVAFMLELLQAEPGQKILDVGSGSGWTTALLAYIIGSGGRVIAIDRIPELVEFGKSNVAKYNFIKKGIVEFNCADGSLGLKKEAPFDRILAGAAAEKVPASLKEQLKINGRLVIPVQNSIYLIIRKGEDKFSQEEFSGFAFVPLIEI
ncbi:MAG: protein-L-isoaspartate(D-aspartate) O-methyltransferase [bacterium]